jgi:hypothetical protein
MMDWDRSGRKLSWPNFKVQSQHLPERLGKTTKNLGQDSHSPSQILTRDLPNTKQECLHHTCIQGRSVHVITVLARLTPRQVKKSYFRCPFILYV